MVIILSIFCMRILAKLDFDLFDCTHVRKSGNTVLVARWDIGGCDEYV